MTSSKRVKAYAIRFSIVGVLCGLFYTVYQDIMIFPQLIASISDGPPRQVDKLPKGVESIFITTSDGEKIESWRLLPSPEVTRSSFVALIAHGNAGILENFFSLQQWFSFQGILSYGFDYRGYGKSSGWPTEDGLYNDIEAVYKYIKTRESLENSKLIVMGYSIGSGPAAYLASKHDPHALILIAPYISMPEIVNDMPGFSFLKSLLRYSFPVKQYLNESKTTCKILAHGEQDTVIASRHTKTIVSEYKGSGQIYQLVSEEAGHNDVFFLLDSALQEALKKCGI